MTTQDFALLKRIVMESASALQAHEDNHLVPDDRHVLTDSQSWGELSDELNRAATLAIAESNALAESGR